MMGNNPRYVATASFRSSNRALYPWKYGRENVSSAGRSPVGTSISASTKFGESLIRETLAEANCSLGRRAAPMEHVSFVCRNDHFPFAVWLWHDVHLARNDNAVYPHQLQLSPSSGLLT
jgi:hypothetical protein